MQNPFTCLVVSGRNSSRKRAGGATPQGRHCLQQCRCLSIFNSIKSHKVTTSNSTSQTPHHFILLVRKGKDHPTASSNAHRPHHRVARVCATHRFAYTDTYTEQPHLPLTSTAHGPSAPVKMKLTFKVCISTLPQCSPS